jgi:hypothetical protein
MNVPRLVGGINRGTVRRDSATSGVAPAFNISCHCNGPAKDLNWSCTCRWWSGGCWGYSDHYADGSWETGSGCRAKS